MTAAPRVPAAVVLRASIQRVSLGVPTTGSTEASSSSGSNASLSSDVEDGLPTHHTDVKDERADSFDLLSSSYPASLVVRNTFFDIEEERPACLQRRRARSLEASTSSRQDDGVDAPFSAAANSASAVEGLSRLRAGVRELTPVPATQPEQHSDASAHIADAIADAVIDRVSTAAPSEPAPVPPAAKGFRSSPVLARSTAAQGRSTAGQCLREREKKELGSPELPTVGSRGHRSGQCRPCGFFWKAVGCGNGSRCQFCHLCDSGEKKRRQKEKKAVLKSMHAADSEAPATPEAKATRVTSGKQ
eukprot:TRINITY_DN11079_c0_g1_i1.p1 TRINITY_DN11079_c0_g1~~TRINITY_DN11079_c0_g1_i1.p1  ORF type:complete len:303 (-),score=62.22 TRINITY_DN11079_c0_g1_i1:521-1429(-)